MCTVYLLKEKKNVHSVLYLETETRDVHCVIYLKTETRDVYGLFRDRDQGCVRFI
jgi:hypothetical protein